MVISHSNTNLLFPNENSCIHIQRGHEWIAGDCRIGNLIRSSLVLGSNSTSTEDVQKALNQGRFFVIRATFFRKRKHNNTDIDKKDCFSNSKKLQSTSIVNSLFFLLLFIF